MGNMERAKNIADLFASYVRQEKKYGAEEIKIHSEEETYYIKIYLSSLQEEVLFKQKNKKGYITIINGEVVSHEHIEEFSYLFDLLELTGEKLLQKTIRPKKKKKKKDIFSPKLSKKIRLDRILERYNDYGLLYEMFQDEKYKRKQEKIVRLLKGLKG